MTAENRVSASIIDQAWRAHDLDIHEAGMEFYRDATATAIRKALAALKLEGPVVEIGAGLGSLGRMAGVQFGDQYVQTEFGEQNCLVAQSNNPNASTLAAKAQELPFKDGAVGTVVAMDVLDVVDTPQVIQEVGRVLRPGGKLVHFHDRQIHLPWAHRQLGLQSGYVAVPEVDEDAISSGFLVAPEQVYLDNFAANPNFSKHFATPENAEQILYGPDTIARTGLSIICERLAQHPETERTAPVGDIFEDVVEDLCHQHGIFATSGVVKSVTHTSAAAATRHFGPAVSNVNMVVRPGDGSYHWSRSPEVPDGSVRILNGVHTVLGIKQ